MAKRYKVVVNMVKGEQAIDLAVQSGQALRVWAASGANYLLQASDERGVAVALVVKAKRVGKDLHLLFDAADSAQVVLIGYFDVASEHHTPLLGRMPDGSLRGYVVQQEGGGGFDASELPDGGELAELAWIDDNRQGAGALTALAPLAAGPGAVVAALGGLAAAAGGGGAGAGANPPALTPEEALNRLQAAARDNTAKGLAASVYQSAGVTGVNDGNLAAVNDVLNTQDVTDTRLPSKAEVQNIVDAYAKVFKAADHIDGNLTDSTAPMAEDYSTLTVSWGLTTQSSALAKMLSDVVDGKGPSDVDTVAKLQALADAVKAVMDYTTRGIGAPSVAQINGLLAGQPGNVAVTDDALAAVQNKILANNTDSNGAIANQSELLSIVKGVMDGYKISLPKIYSFAHNQSSGLQGSPIPVETIPTLADYDNVGVGGVSQGNLDAINDALASKTVDTDTVSTSARLQKVIDAYNAILAEANGPDRPDATPDNPTKQQYAAIGTNFGSIISDSELALLNDAVGAQTTLGVDTIVEINNLARIAKTIQSLAAGLEPNPGLRAEDLVALGLNAAVLNNDARWAAFLRVITTKADDGSETDSLSELQAIIDSVPSNNSVSPVVLDLNGDGTLSYTQQLMDVTGDGQAEYTAWAAAQDGVLVRDADGDGRLTRPSEFAFARSSNETDLQGLAAQYDSNHDGRLSAEDADFAQFKVWQDANGNGVCDAGELHSLSALGITSISLHSDGVQGQPAPGVREMGQTQATRIDGSHRVVADSAFAHSPAPIQSSPIDGAQLRLDLMADPLVLNLANLRAVYGDVRELHLGAQSHNTLRIQLEDVLAQPVQVNGGVGTVELFTDGRTLSLTPVLYQGMTYLACDANHDGHVDLLIQSSLTVQMH